MKIRKAAPLLTLCCLLLFLPGCATGAAVQTRTAMDLNGSEIQVPETAARIAAVYGPSYETLAVLGAEDRVVVCADVQVETFPWARRVFPRMETLPYLENVHTAVNIEALLTYHPDLVLGFPRPNEEKKLKEAGICSISGKTVTGLSQIPAQLKACAEALGGDAPAAAAEYEGYFNEKLAAVKAVTDTIPAAGRPKVYFAGSDLLTTYGKYSDIPELIETAGGNPVTKELEAGSRVQINFEQLTAYNPDYIFIDHGSIGDRQTAEEIQSGAYGDGRYSVIGAVRNRGIYLAPSGVYFWDMGLQKILLLEYMAKILHPDAFSRLDMAAEVQDFYTRFFDYTLTREEAVKILSRQDP